MDGERLSVLSVVLRAYGQLLPMLIVARTHGTAFLQHVSMFLHTMLLFRRGWQDIVQQKHPTFAQSVDRTGRCVQDETGVTAFSFHSQFKNGGFAGRQDASCAASQWGSKVGATNRS